METKESNKKRIVKNTAFLYLRMFVVLAASFFTSRVVLEALGETDYGIYNVVGGVVTMMSFLSGTLSTATSRFLTYELGRGVHLFLSNTFSAALNLHILVAILIIILGETAGVWFLYNKMTIPPSQLNAAFWVLQCSIISTSFSISQIPFNASLISHENMYIFAYIGLYEAFSKLGIAYIIQIGQGNRLIFYSFLLMINTILILLFYQCYTHRHYSECRFKIIKDAALYRQLISYSGWNIFGSLGYVSQTQGINIVLNIFFGPTINAARAIATQIQIGLQSFVNNFLTAIRPRVVKNFAEDNINSMFKLTFYGCKIAYFLMLIIVLPVAFEMNFILKIWLGDHIPFMTNIFAWIMLAMILSDSIYQAFLMAYHAVGKIKYGSIIVGGLMIFTLPVSYLVLKSGAPPYSVFLICLIFNFFGHMICWKLLHDEVYFSYIELIKKVYLPCITVSILSLMTPLTVISLLDEGWLRLIILSTATSISTLFLILYLGLNKQERQELVIPIYHKIRVIFAK